MRHQLTAANGGSIHVGRTRVKTGARPWLFAACVAALGFAAPAQAAVFGFSLTGDGYSLTGAFTTATNVSPADPDPNCGTAGANPCRSDPAGGYTVNVWGDGDLHGPGTTAYGVNVVQNGTFLSSSFDGLNGSAVPEPSTWALMLVAFAGLGWRLRRQRVGALA